MLTIPISIDDNFCNILNHNKKLAVEFTKEMLKINNVSYSTSKGFTTFNIDNTKYLVRLSKGSSSEKGLGRTNIKDNTFSNKFDSYLYPSFELDKISFTSVPK